VSEEAFDPDVAIARIAARQHNVFTSAQALAAGITAAGITRRCQSGRWERLEPRVYRIAGSAQSWEQRLMRAVLGAGAGAAVSHRAAALLWELDGIEGRPVEVTVPRGRRYRRAIVHESLRVRAGELTERRGIRVTKPIPTLIGLGTVLDEDALECAYESALRRGYTTDHVTLRSLDGRHGTAPLRRVLARRGVGTPATESELETRFLQIVRRARLPAPQRQIRVGRRRLDFAWPSWRLAVELDGMAHHTGRLARQRDNTRQNEVVLLQWAVLRFTWCDVTQRPQQVVADLVRVLAA
jgi:very-short-patch-repair endonuclease